MKSLMLEYPKDEAWLNITFGRAVADVKTLSPSIWANTPLVFNAYMEKMKYPVSYIYLFHFRRNLSISDESIHGPYAVGMKVRQGRSIP